MPEAHRHPRPKQRRPLVPGWLWSVIALLAVGVAVAGVTGGKSSSKPAFVPATVAVAHYSTLPVYASPGGAVTRRLANPDPTNYSQPQVLLVLQNSGDWLQVSLPVAPNGQTGWVRTNQVTLHQNDYRIDVLRTAHQLRVYRQNVLQKSYPIAVGTADTPTPGGVYFLKVLLQPPNPNGAYGPYAYGLSGYSSVLTSFDGGTGVIGIHGTDQPQVIGHDASHGCIRLTDADITDLHNRFNLKLGTPVRILA
ncbi:MAG TPA: L,D-transpeptidase [Frankiaceae bacterium]|nr:L,D-transpeptidase [Frankiaceae bacterium]